MEIRVLGSVEIIGTDGPVSLGAAKQRRLLAALAIRAGEVLPSDVLIDAVWGASPPASATKLLQVYVSQRRKALEPPVGIQTRGAGYALELGQESLDAVRFERLIGDGRAAALDGNAALAVSRLRRALALWRGPAYGEFAYEEFARGEAERLDELRLVALEGRIAAELALGRHGDVLPELQSLAAAHPLRERIQAQTMLALYRSGRQSDALEIYVRTRAKLSGELGLEPGPALREMQSAILNQDPSLAAPAVTDGHSRRLISFSPGPAVTGLLERGDQLQRVDVMLGRASTGAGSVAVAEGPAGIGKSALLAAVGRSADACGFGVLRARGSEFEREIAFGAVRQLFEPMLRAASPPERRRLIDGVARVGARALGVEAGEPPGDRFAAIHGLFWVCANRTERGPLVVLVDDVQWADDPSLAWLGYLARRVGDLPLALVLGLRSGDPGGERAELARMVGNGGVQRLALAPLTAGAVSAIVRAQLDQGAEESFCRAVSDLSGGNPLFIRELLTCTREEGLAARGECVPTLERLAPVAVGTSVLGRLGRLGAESVALARAVAVFGAGAEVSLAARLAGIDPAVAELTADRLAAAQILRPVRPLEFVHPLIGAAIHEDMAPGARRIAHRRAATLLDTGGDGSLARVAAHLLGSGPAGDRWVVARLRDAAAEALGRGAPDVAARYIRRALSEPPVRRERAGLVFMLGTAEWRAAEPDAIAHLEQALAAACDDRITARDASSLLATAYVVTGQVESAITMLERALAVAGDRDGRLALTLEASIAGVGMMNERTAAAALARAEALRGRLPGLADPPLHLFAVLAGYAARNNRAAEAQQLVERALACEPYPPPFVLGDTLMDILCTIERYDQALHLGKDLLAAARRRGAMHEIVGISVSRAAACLECGAVADAEADARWALEHASGVRRTRALGEVIRVLIERDALDMAEHELTQVADPEAPGSVEWVRLLRARGRLRTAQGRLDEGLADLLECGRRCERLGLLTLSATLWRVDAALVHAEFGNVGEAQRLASEQLKLARTFDRPRTVAISLRACGLIDGGERGLEMLEEAVQTLQRSQSALDLARALADYGGALRRAGRRVQARAELERALDLAHRWGATRIANQARAELIAAGAKPRRDAITGRDALTAGELRVARLAAQGLTNREVAQALFITTKTVKAHLN